MRRGEAHGYDCLSKEELLGWGVHFTIQPVTKETVGAILELIRELAQFERLDHEVVATEETLRDALCGSHAAAGALLAYQGKELAGYAIYYFTFSSFVGRRGIWLEDVYVRPAFRNKGLGRKFIQAVARIGAARNCGRFEWAALNWNRNAIEFYRRLGARTLDDWVMLRLNADGLRRLAATEAQSGGAEDSLAKPHPTK